MDIGYAIDTLECMLKHPDRINGSDAIMRPTCREAVTMAYDALPECRDKRVLLYVMSHDRLIYNFTGTDAVAPAIRNGIEWLRSLNTKPF